MKILIIEDEAHVCKILDRILTSRGHQVCTCNSCTEALQGSGRIPDPEVILLDGMLGDERGPEHIPSLRVSFADATIVGMSGLLPERSFMEAGADHFIAKPFRQVELNDLMEEIHKSRRAR